MDFRSATCVPRLCCLLTALVAITLSLTAAGQNPAAVDAMINGPDSLRGRMATIDSYATAPNTGAIAVHVFSESNGLRLDRQALLKLVDRATQSTLWQTTYEGALGVFTNVPYGSYDIEVSAVGYLSSHREVQVSSVLVQVQFDVVLQRDPTAVNLDVDNNSLSPKSRKETKRAVIALKSGNLKDAEKHLAEAYQSAPSDANLNFLFGYLYFQKKDFARAVSYLNASTQVNPRNGQALTLLGRAGLEQRDYPVARSALEKAVLADSENWLPHNLLADTYLHQRDYGKARDEAQIAITKGKGIASSAQLVLGQALLNLGQSREGVQALQGFLEQSPQHPIAGEVRNLIAEFSARADAPSIAEEPPASKLTGVDPLLALPAPKLSITAWQPPGVDEVPVAVAPDIGCPTSKVLEESGKRVQELVADVARFAAVEDLFHQALDEYGTPVRTETRKFNYVASISEPEPGYLAVEEYRADKLSLSGYPDNIASTGFASLALAFHPHMRDSFDMICEGLGDWHGQATWLIHFRQRNDRTNRLHSYKIGNQMHSVPLKGRAWITNDKFQIVRIEAEMVAPMPEIQLLSEHQIVEYGPVPFAKQNMSLWLPKSAELYFDFRKHRYYRRHSFDHYMLYSVDTEEKPKLPSAKQATEKKQ